MAISYRKMQNRYKWETTEAYDIQTAIKPTETICFGYITLQTDGMLHLADGYKWDGASGPAFDTVSFMEGSAVHDAIYRLMRKGMLSWKFKPKADKLMRQINKREGMKFPRRWWTYTGVRWFAGERE